MRGDWRRFRVFRFAFEWRRNKFGDDISKHLGAIVRINRLAEGLAASVVG
jgi:hypothetical protein